MTINREAPVVQTKGITINAEPEKVWEVLTEFKNWPNWNTKIKDPIIKVKPRVGASFTWKTNGSKIKSEIHTYNQNSALGWKGKTFGAKAIHNWYLKPTVNGTRVKVEESMEGWIISLMKKKMNNIIENDMIYWLDHLKEECEK